MKKNLKSLDLNIISELILSILLLLMGVLIMIFKTFGLIDVVLYGSVLFYIYAVLSTIFYFIGRREGDYELLLLALINIITATFMFVFKEDNPAMILGAGMTIFTILLVANRGVKIIELKREENYTWMIKFIVTFPIGFLGMLSTYNFFNNVTVQTMMFGFYFISLGFIQGIENIINIFLTNSAFKKILTKIIEEDSSKKLEEIKQIPQKIEKSKKIEVATKKVKKETPKIEEKITDKKSKTKPVVIPSKAKVSIKTGNIEKETKTTTKTKNNTKVEKETKTVTKEKNTSKKIVKDEKKKVAEVKTPTVKKVSKAVSKPKKQEEKTKSISKKTTTKTETKKVGRPKKEMIEETPKKKVGRPKKTTN